jgi:hypothetical protein
VAARAAAEHPAWRAGTLRYACGVTLVQLCWIGRLWLPGLAGVIGFVVLVAAELAVPAWAYAHYAVFAAVAAFGAGLQVVIGTVRHETPVSPVFAALTVALPAAIVLIMLGMLTPAPAEADPSAPDSSP